MNKSDLVELITNKNTYLTKKDIDDVLSFATIHQHQHIIDKLKNFKT